MKIRLGFVSNSSSSSFIVTRDSIIKEFPKIIEEIENKKDNLKEDLLNKEIKYYSKYEWFNEEKTEKEIQGKIDNTLDILKNFEKYSTRIDLDKLKKMEEEEYWYIKDYLELVENKNLGIIKKVKKSDLDWAYREADRILKKKFKYKIISLCHDKKRDYYRYVGK